MLIKLNYKFIKLEQRIINWIRSKWIQLHYLSLTSVASWNPLSVVAAAWAALGAGSADGIGTPWCLPVLYVLVWHIWNGIKCRLQLGRGMLWYGHHPQIPETVSGRSSQAVAIHMISDSKKKIRLWVKLMQKNTIERNSLKHDVWHTTKTTWLNYIWLMIIQFSQHESKCIHIFQ